MFGPSTGGLEGAWKLHELSPVLVGNETKDMVQDEMTAKIATIKDMAM